MPKEDSMVIWGSGAERAYWKIVNREFPWLWAIRSVWSPFLRDIRIKRINAGKSPHDFVGLESILMDPSDKPDREVWIRWTRGSAEGVDRITPHREKSLAQRIVQLTESDMRIRNVVIIYTANRQTMLLYKPPKQDNAFNRMIERAVIPSRVAL